MMRRKYLASVLVCAVTLMLISGIAVGAPTPPTVWYHTTVEGTNNVGNDVNIAISPDTGTIFISYYDMTNTAMRVAEYVANGGNCGDGEWECVTIAGGPRSTVDAGAYNDIAVNPDTGFPVVVYYDRTNNELVYAGATCASVSCQWGTQTVDSTSVLFTSVGAYPSLQFGTDGLPQIAYWYNNAFSNPDELRHAKFVNSGGNCGGGRWECTTVESGLGYGLMPSLDLTRTYAPYNNPYIASYDATSGNLRFAWYLGTGTGNCGGGDWNCQVIDSSGDVGAFPAFTASNGSATFGAIAYLDRDNGQMKIARSGIPGGTGNCGGGHWQCSVIYNTGGQNDEIVGSGVTRIPGGPPYFVFGCPGCYGTGVVTVLYVGSGGSCLNPEYDCYRIASDPITLHDRSKYADIAVSGSYMPIVAYFDEHDADVRVAVERYPIYLPISLLD